MSSDGVQIGDRSSPSLFLQPLRPALLPPDLRGLCGLLEHDRGVARSRLQPLVGSRACLLWRRGRRSLRACDDAVALLCAVWHHHPQHMGRCCRPASAAHHLYAPQRRGRRCAVKPAAHRIGIRLEE